MHGKTDADDEHVVRHSWIPPRAGDNDHTVMPLAQHERQCADLWEDDGCPGVVVAARGPYRVTATESGYRVAYSTSHPPWSMGTGDGGDDDLVDDGGEGAESRMFDWAIHLSPSWCRRDQNVATTAATSSACPFAHGGQHRIELFAQMLEAGVDDCMYQMCLCAHRDGEWQVLKRYGTLNTASSTGADTSAPPSDPLCALALDLPRWVLPVAHDAASATTSSAAPCFLGFTRVDFADVTREHVIELHDLYVHAPSAVSSASSGAASAPTLSASDLEEMTTLSGAMREHMSLEVARVDDLAQLYHPIAIVKRAQLRAAHTTGPITLGFTLQGTVRGATHLMLSLVLVSPAGEHPPLSAPLCVQSSTATDGGAAGAHPFSGTANHVVDVTDLERIDVYLHASPSSSSGGSRKKGGMDIVLSALDMVHTPLSMWGGGGSGGMLSNNMHEDNLHGGGSGLVDIGEINALKHAVQRVNQHVEEVQRTPGPVGAKGPRGPRGERGDCFRFEDLDEKQREALRGRRGAPGPRGELLRFEDLTEYQRKSLIGPRGETGKQGDTGVRGERGERGKALRLRDLDAEQREELRGEQGKCGARGEPFHFEDFSAEQLEGLRGPIGLRGPTGDQGDRGQRGAIGLTGPLGPEGRHGPRGLPGIPGETGPRGEIGGSGTDGHNGQSAVIKTSFASEELLRKFVHKSQHVEANTYYLVNNEESEEHGHLFVYTGTVVYEFTIGCTYPENVASMLGNYEATLDTKVRVGKDEWQLRVSVHSRTTCVYQLAMAMLKTIKQGGYPTRDVGVVDDAIVQVGRLCGPRGHRGGRGAPGPEGRTMLGMRLDYIGDEVQRMQTEPETNAIFLQVTESKNHGAGFYLFNHHTNAWSLLHGIAIDDEFTAWMAQFVENPDNDSVPMALSLFSTVQKRVETSCRALREEFMGYRDTNDKWKKFQFEQWKALSNSQFQRLNDQILEVQKELESSASLVAAAGGVGGSGGAAGGSHEDLELMRKSVDRQHLKLEKVVHRLRQTLDEVKDREVSQTALTDKRQEQVQAKLREFDSSLLKILKLIQYFKTTPWVKPLKALKAEIDHVALELTTTKSALDKEVDVAKTRVAETNATVRGLQDGLDVMGETVRKQEVSSEQRLVEHADQLDKRLLQISGEGAERASKVQKELTGRIGKQGSELLAQISKESYALKQEMLESATVQRELIARTEQKMQDRDRAFEKQLQDTEHQMQTTTKKQLSACELSTRGIVSELQLALDALEQRIEKGDKRHTEFAKELPWLGETLQKRLVASEGKGVEQLKAGLAKMADDVARRLQQLSEQHSTQTKAVEKASREGLEDIKQLLTEARSSFADGQQQQTQGIEAVRVKLLEQLEQAAERWQGKLAHVAQEHSEHVRELSDDVGVRLKTVRDDHSHSSKATHALIHEHDLKHSAGLTECRQAITDRVDERLRESEAKQHAARQDIVGDVSSLDNKCNTIEYLLKARLESIEEHIQQLFSEAQQQCADTCTKHKKELTATFETVRNELVRGQKKEVQQLSEQQQRAEKALQARHEEASTRLDAHEQTQEVQRRDFGRLQREFNEIERRLQKEHQRVLTDVEQKSEVNRQAVADLKAHVTKMVQGVRQDVLGEMRKIVDTTMRETWTQQLAEVEKRLSERYQRDLSAAQQRLDVLCTSVEDVHKRMQQVSTGEQEYQAAHKQRFNTMVERLDRAVLDVLGLEDNRGGSGAVAVPPLVTASSS